MLEDFKVQLGMFCNRITEIENYVDLIELEKYLYKKPRQNEKLKDCLRRNYNSSVFYNALIITIYGCYENFVDKLLIAFLDKLSKYFTDYNKFSKKFRDTHMKITGEFLQNSQRFRDLDITVDDTIENLFTCISGKTDFKLNNKLLIKHSGNLTIKALNELFGQIGIRICPELRGN
jgi:phosphatidylserine/phosphatidylglycerophosphate/cardiolipin synthase-like enzyme